IYTAFKNDNFNPARFGGGMAKLIFYAILVILFHQADHIIQEMVGHHIELEIISARSWALAYIGSHELLSALNKLKNLGIPIPQKLYNMIKTNKDKLDL
ncbi:MAG TPA: phage holin family protein, partial [Candidatus Absconditabacterales bacterium]|nr:phage holin family protein [Candidatus Absconditabacterales bacterium]